ncbi:hypothetical protein pb186bvf_009155 [Paramecium bursaria]
MNICGALVNGLKQGVRHQQQVRWLRVFLEAFESNNYQGLGNQIGNGVTYKGDWQNKEAKDLVQKPFCEEYYGMILKPVWWDSAQYKQQQKQLKKDYLNLANQVDSQLVQDGAQREYKGLQDGGPEIIFNHFREIRSIEEIMNIQPNQRIEVKKKELQDKSRDLNQRKRALLEQKKQCFQYETKAYEHMKSLQSLVDYVQILFNFFFMIRLKLVIIDVMSH